MEHVYVLQEHVRELEFACVEQSAHADAREVVLLAVELREHLSIFVVVVVNFSFNFEFQYYIVTKTKTCFY